jgi:hypothetical protein
MAEQQDVAARFSNVDAGRGSLENVAADRERVTTYAGVWELAVQLPYSGSEDGLQANVSGQPGLPGRRDSEAQSCRARAV